MQQVFKGGTCNPTHITQENKAKIKLSPRRPGGSPCSAPAATNRTHPAHTHPQRDSREACPSRSQWEYKTVGFLFGYFAVRSLKFARATSSARRADLHPLLQAASPGTRAQPARLRPPRSRAEREGHSFIQQHEVYPKQASSPLSLQLLK